MLPVLAARTNRWKSCRVLGRGGSSLLGYIIPFLFVLTLVVFFHELGHFWVARRAGVRVLTFSLGFGPEIAGFNDRHGTRWAPVCRAARRLCAILWRRGCRQHARQGALGANVAPGAARELLFPASGMACCHRGRRADRQFHSGDRYFLHGLHGVRPSGERAARGSDSIPRAPRSVPGSSRATSC